MLSSLHIENIAVIKLADIDFQNNMTVLTGETGAGKSVLLGALNLVLGQKANKELIRSGCEKAFVSATFSGLPEGLIALLTENGYEADEELILSRELTIAGKTVARINGRPCTVQLLYEAGVFLLNIHGQHDNQSLLNEAMHLSILDRMCECPAVRKAYFEAYTILKRAKKELDQLQKSNTEREQRLDILKYRIKELQEADITVGEMEELETERKKIVNAEKIRTAFSYAKSCIEGDENFGGASWALTNAAKSLTSAAPFTPEAQKLSEQLSELSFALEEVNDLVSETLNGLLFDAERQEMIADRLALLAKLKRKYGETEESMLVVLEENIHEYELLNDSDNKIIQLKDEFGKALEKARYYSGELTLKRKEAAKYFCSSVAEELAFLQMSGVKLEAQFESAPFSSSGCDKVVFLISANPGEPAKSISKIASGGELSRIMLAIRSVLADRDEITTLVFDEIDAGVSGRAANKIGMKLAFVAKDKQVICITHLAQIAAFANHQFLIEKSVEDGHSQTNITELDDFGRVEELARILGGAQITDATRKNAEELLMQGKITV